MPITVHNPREEGLIEYPDGVSDEEIINHLDSLVNDPYGPSAVPDYETFRRVMEWMPGFGEYYAGKDLKEWYDNYSKLSQKEALDPKKLATGLFPLAGVLAGAGEAKSIKQGFKKLFNIETGKLEITPVTKQAASYIKAQEMESELMQQILKTRQDPNQPVMSDALYKETIKELNNKVFHETGWYRDIDGEWKWEIPDTGANLKITKEQYPYGLKRSTGNLKLGEILDHDLLYKEYPELKDFSIKLYYEPDQNQLDAIIDHDLQGNLGWMDWNKKQIVVAGKDPEEIRRTLLHEIQHAIQKKEGFAFGGPGGVNDAGVANVLEGLLHNYRIDRDKTNNIIGMLQRGRMPDLSPETVDLTIQHLDDLVNQEQQMINQMKEVLPEQVYHRLKGEIESRNVEIRDYWRRSLEQQPGDTIIMYGREYPRQTIETLLAKIPTDTEDTKGGVALVVKPRPTR